MLHWSRAVLALLAVALGLAACVSLKRTPEARFFFLRPLAEPALEGERGAGQVVGVMPARLPGHLERPQVVTEVAPGELRIDEFLRWAEPLDAGVTRTVAENLANLLPDDRIVRFPWRAMTPVRCRVLVELSEFGLHEGPDVRLVGRWTLLPPGRERALGMQPVSLRHGPLPSGPAGVVDPADAVEAMSALLAELSRQIALGVRALPPDAEPATP